MTLAGTTEPHAIKPTRHFAVDCIRRDFPLLERRVHDKPLIYLDNAATTQKPQSVIDAIVDYYTNLNSNIHRGVHYLSEAATRHYEEARVKVQRFINAADPREVIFVRGCTEGINLVAASFGALRLRAGDEVVISAVEHHSNIVPWQLICQSTGAQLRVIPINDAGEILLDQFEKMLTSRTKLVAIVHLSNALGTINPIGEVISKAHAHGIPVLVDGAQSTPHIPIDVRALDVDFFAFSGHKMYGPTGIGVLYGKRALLEEMPPYQGGGDMISSVSFEKTTYNSLPYKFEAGTPDIAGVIGLGAAIDYLSSIGLPAIASHETDLLSYGTTALGEIPQVRFIGTAAQKASVISFVVEGIHPHDIGTILDRDGVAIRTGHHCAQPVMERFGIPATARASFAMYNTRAEIDALVSSLRKAIEWMS